MEVHGTAIRELEQVLVDLIDPASSQTVMTIGEVASKLGLTPRTIRFYETAGLVSPRRSGRFRLYSNEDLGRLRLVRLFRSWDADIDAIRNMLSGLEDAKEHGHLKEGILRAARQQAAKLTKAISVANRSLEDCKSIIGHIDQGK
jgi:DNA-binding transcriptional MerR regulator